jgi:SPP1 gp7 family putative phage head morphogenesis protein
MEIKDLISIPFEEAIEAFSQTVTLTPEEFYLLADEAKAKAFTVAGVSKLDILNDVYKELNKVFEEGTPLGEFQKNVDKLFERKGWAKKDKLPAYRVENIYRTNIQKHFQAGRYKQQTDPDILIRRPFWEYDAINDNATRPSHKALDKTVKRADDPFWETYYPPNGFKCRCSVRSRSARDLERRGLKLTEGLPKIKEGLNRGMVAVPDTHWNHNPAKEIWNPDLSKYPKKLRDKFTKERGEKE